MGMDVIVIGAGYAGLLAANRMARRARVLLINRTEVAVDRIRLHQLVAGTRTQQQVTRRLRDGLDPRVELVVGEVVSAQPELVALADGRELSAKQVLIACGRAVAKPRGLDSLEAALARRDELARLSSGTVEIIGAGLTGIETATEVAAARPDLSVRLVCRNPPGASYAPNTQAYLLTRFEQLGIELTITSADAQLTIDATGAEPEPLTGQPLVVDPAMRVLGEHGPIPGLWGAGDAVHVMGQSWLGSGCATAMPMGATAADAILATLAGREPKPLDFGYDKRCISLGRGWGSYEFLRPDGSATGRALTGRLGALGKELISRAAWVVPARFSRTYGPAAWARAPR